MNRFNNPYNFISYPVPYPPIYYNSTTPSNMYYPPGSNMYFVPGSSILNGLVPLGPEETQPPSEMVMESESTPSSPNKRTRKHRHSNKNASKHDSHSDVIDSLIVYFDDGLKMRRFPRKLRRCLKKIQRTSLAINCSFMYNPITRRINSTRAPSQS